jgi:DNA polymerase-3 subunit epsilon
MLDLPLAEIPFVFLDTETTGLSPRFGDRMVEIALARFRGDVMENFFTTLLNPERSISPGASRIHGITERDVIHAPRFRDIAAQVRAELEGAVIVAHNAPFDLGFVGTELEYARASLPPIWALDTVLLLRRHFSFRSNALQRVADALGIERSTMHRALADVLTTRAVFEYIVEELRPHTLGELLELQGGTIEWRNPGAREELTLPPALEEALRSHRKLFLRYVDEFGAKSERWVSVVNVHARKEYIYLRAHCHLRDAERYFRLDRVLEMQVEEQGDRSGVR